MYAYGYGYPMGSQSNPAYIPPSIPNLGLWLDERGQTLVGGALDVWNDQSGNGRHFSAPALANRPAITTVKGKPVPDFDGTDDYLTGNAASLTLAQAVTGLTVIQVTQYVASTIQRSFGLSTGDSATNVRHLSGVSATEWQAGGRRLDADSTVVLGGGTVNANLIVQSAVIRYSLATASVRVNGASQFDTAFQTAGNTSNTASQRSVIGCGLNLANFLNGTMCELIAYQRALSVTELQVLESYLMNKWL
jgi:hypothetical protein